MEGNKETKPKRANKRQQYIVEDEDEPLDLLDKRSLAHVSSTKPQKARPTKLASKPKFNEEGKMVLGADDSDDEAEDPDMGIGENEDLGAAVSAYVQAISGKHAMKRGQRNRIKFSNKKWQREDDGDDDMEDVEKPKKVVLPPKSSEIRNGQGIRSGQGMRTVRGGRVQKGRSGGGGGGRGRGGGGARGRGGRR